MAFNRVGRLRPLVRTGEQCGLLTLTVTGKRFIVRADEKLSAFLELERAIHEFAVGLVS
jgi:hypothetical protein